MPCPGFNATDGTACSNHGQCDTATGTCVCSADWSGDTLCSTCTAGTPNCHPGTKPWVVPTAIGVSSVTVLAAIVGVVLCRRRSSSSSAARARLLGGGRGGRVSSSSSSFVGYIVPFDPDALQLQGGTGRALDSMVQEVVPQEGRPRRIVLPRRLGLAGSATGTSHNYSTFHAEL